jgi:hypothetical protein
MTLMSTPLGQKRLELLRELAPKASHGAMDGNGLDYARRWRHAPTVKAGVASGAS